MSGLSPDLLSGWIDELEALEHWAALFSSDPLGVGSPSSVEIAGDVYARQDAIGLFTRTGTTSLTLSSALVFRGLEPGVTVAAVGFFDSAFGTTGFLHRSMVPGGAKSYPAGGTFVLPAGEYVVGLDL